MKMTMLLGLLFFAITPLQAQDLGGVGDFVANVAKSARGGSAVDLKLHTSGVLYVPFPSIHSTTGSIEYAVLGLGADLSGGVEGTKLHGAPLVLPMLNVLGLTDKLFSSEWSQNHLTFPILGDLSLGLGIKPLPVVGSHGKWVIGNQTEAVLTFGLGKK